MAKKKKTILEAVDTLSHLVDLDVEKKKQADWLDPAKLQQNQAVISETFEAINTYLQHAYQKDRSDLAERKRQRGIRSMIQLAGEAVEKVGRYTALLKEGPHAKEVSEFKKLEQFYKSKVFSKLRKDSGEEGWELQGGTEKRQVIKDLEMVRSDQNYELFYMTYEDGAPFFTPNLLRHLRMVGNFDETFISSTQQETILSKFDVVLDKDLHQMAQKILSDCSDLIDLFYKDALHHKHQEMVVTTSKAVMALFLAANPKNLRYNLAQPDGKCTIDYWRDFVFYLRKAACSKPIEEREVCQKLILQLSHALFLSMTPKDDDLELISHLAGKSKAPFFQSLLEAEKNIIQELQNYPSGPLMKVLKVFRNQENGKGYDPLLQNNAPHPLFTLVTEDLHMTVVHMAAPIYRRKIERAEVVPEFTAYLQSLGERAHLYVNLQEPNSWKEAACCKVLKEVGEKSSHFKLFNLSKDSDFYHQIGLHTDVNEASLFCNRAEEHLGHRDLVQFVQAQFFEGQKTLSREERLSFIEILYFFIVLKHIDQEKPDILSFSCKDGIDIGSTTAASFYGFIRMLSTDADWKEADRDCFLYTLFAPALLVRNRSVSSSRLHRVINGLKHFEAVLKAHRHQVLKACAKVLPETSLKSLKISEAA